MSSLELWFEFASTYSYLSVMRASKHVAERTNGRVTVVRRPFLLGPIFREQGYSDSPFNLQPLKGRYMWRDMERRAARHGLEFRRPSVFPRNGLHAARIALVAEDEGWGEAWSRAVFHASFAADQDIGSLEVLHTLLQGLEREPEEITAKATAADTKERLRAQTERARQLGLFGAPTWVAKGELFWGDDRLDDALDWLGE